jgi:hypothetical protein
MSQGFARSSRMNEAAATPGSVPMMMADARADDHRRRVVLSSDRVTIDRHYRGIAMRLSIPVEAYQGVCVALKPARSGGFLYEIRLAHRDAELSVSLAEAADDSEIWADWRSWARFFGLPALIERNDGLVDWAKASGTTNQSWLTARRVKKRRPGFIARRFTPAGAPGVVHREPEIIARD